MVRLNEIRANEVAVDLPTINDARLIFIGRIRTPWTNRLECPRQGRADGPLCTIEIDERWQQALDGIEAFSRIEVLYWLHESRRDLVKQSRRTMERRTGHSRCGRRCGRTRSARRSPIWCPATTMCCPCAGSTAWTERR